MSSLGQFLYYRRVRTVTRLLHSVNFYITDESEPSLVFFTRSTFILPTSQNRHSSSSLTDPYIYYHHFLICHSSIPHICINADVTPLQSPTLCSEPTCKNRALLSLPLNNVASWGNAITAARKIVSKSACRIDNTGSVAVLRVCGS